MSEFYSDFPPECFIVAGNSKPNIEFTKSGNYIRGWACCFWNGDDVKSELPVVTIGVKCIVAERDNGLLCVACRDGAQISHNKKKRKGGTD